MDQTPHSHWRQMFERGRQDRPPDGFGMQQAADMQPRPAQVSPFGYDDGHDPARHSTTLPSPREVADEAALALADDIKEYCPWILQRGSRPLMMLHLRRFDAQAGLWLGWQVSYPHLIAVEYVGDRMLNLDFGARHFVVEGTGLDQLAAHLQSATVQMVQEYAPDIWGKAQPVPTIRGIRCLAPKGTRAD